MERANLRYFSDEQKIVMRTLTENVHNQILDSLLGGSAFVDMQENIGDIYLYITVVLIANILTNAHLARTEVHGEDREILHKVMQQVYQELVERVNTNLEIAGEENATNE